MRISKKYKTTPPPKKQQKNKKQNNNNKQNKQTNKNQDAIRGNISSTLQVSVPIPLLGLLDIPHMPAP